MIWFQVPKFSFVWVAEAVLPLVFHRNLAKFDRLRGWLLTDVDLSEDMGIAIAKVLQHLFVAFNSEFMH